MPSLHTVWCGHQCSVLCFACCCATLHHLLTSNANANRALVPQYRNVSAVVSLRAVGKRCQTSCTTWLYYHGIVQSCSTVTLCILHFAGGFPHTIRSTFRSQRSARFHFSMAWPIILWSILTIMTTVHTLCYGLLQIKVYLCELCELGRNYCSP